jgi:hypothetical protein
MHQRAALEAGEHRRVDLLGDRLVIGEDHAAARAAQCLVRGGGDDMGVRQGAGMHAGRDQPGEMRHVHHEDRADTVGDLAKTGEIDDARIGRAAGNDDARLVLAGEALHLVEIDAVVLAGHAILHRLEPFAGHVRCRAMGEMAAGRQTHAENGVAGLGEGEHDALVGLRAGMRLDIGVGAGKQPLGALDGDGLGDIDELAAAVIALARIALGIFVGEDAARRFQHRPRDDVLGGDQLDLMLLASQLLADGVEQFGIALGERLREKLILLRRGRQGVRSRHCAFHG